MEDDKLRRVVVDLSSRAESTLISWNTYVRDRSKPRAVQAPNAEANRIVEEEKLRQQLAQLEREHAAVEQEFQAKEANVRHWEERANTAMRHSDAVAADEAHRAHAEHSAALRVLERELTILRALMKACRDVL
jgi:hypothetical protein